MECKGKKSHVLFQVKQPEEAASPRNESSNTYEHLERVAENDDGEVYDHYNRDNIDRLSLRGHTQEITRAGPVSQYN